MRSRILTVPNQLTFLRLAFLPFFILAIHYERYGLALVILIVAGFTDALDGLLARDVLLLVAAAVILITVGYRPFPPSLYGKATTFFEILLIVLVLLLEIQDDRALWIARYLCSYLVAAF